MKITLYYTFNQRYLHKDIDVFVKERSFPYTIIIRDDEADMSVNDLLSSYRDEALDYAARLTLCEEVYDKPF